MIFLIILEAFFFFNFFGCSFSSGDISPPRGVRAAMEMQAEAERKKRAQILESEGVNLIFQFLWGSRIMFNLTIILKLMLAPHVIHFAAFVIHMH